jgi:hypothetical protein
VVPVDPVKIGVPVAVVGELLALIRVDEPVALLGVDDPLVPVKIVVAGDSPCPLVLVKMVEPVSVVPVLERIVVCVAPVIPTVLKEKHLLPKEDYVPNQ